MAFTLAVSSLSRQCPIPRLQLIHAGPGDDPLMASPSIMAFGTISSRSSPGLTAAISSNDSVPTEGLKGKPSRCERLPGVDP